MENLRKSKLPYAVVRVHGDPCATGEMAPAAQQMSEYTGIQEPLSATLKNFSFKL